MPISRLLCHETPYSPKEIWATMCLYLSQCLLAYQLKFAFICYFFLTVHSSFCSHSNVPGLNCTENSCPSGA